MKKAEAAWVLDLKKQLPYLEVEDGSSARDAQVAGYLLNPLKDTYDYDDLARDYLGMTVPSKGRSSWQAVFRKRVGARE